TVLAGISYEFERIANGRARSEWQEFRGLRLGETPSTKAAIQQTLGKLMEIERMVREERHPATGIVPPQEPDVDATQDTGSVLGVVPPVDPTRKHYFYTFYLSSSDH